MAVTDSIRTLMMRGTPKTVSRRTERDVITIEIKAGEVLALLGENGAGKTADECSLWPLSA